MKKNITIYEVHDYGVPLRMLRTDEDGEEWINANELCHALAIDITTNINNYTQQKNLDTLNSLDKIIEINRSVH